MINHLTSMQQLNLLAVFLVAAGILGYILIALRHLEHFKLRNNLGEMLVEIFTHVNQSGASPLIHIISGLCFISGASILIAETIALLLLGPDPGLEGVIGLSGFAVAVLFSIISIWTLWQTRRIAFAQGLSVGEMQDLISRINEEVSALIVSFRNKHKCRAQPFHRFLLVTSQPLFGSLSDVGDELAERFEQNMRALANCQRQSQSEDNSRPFQFEIVCGNGTLIEDFHAQYFAGNNDEIDRLNIKVERFLQGLEEESSSDYQVVYRKARIPPVQFVIVGNVVVTFNLQTVNAATAIVDAAVHRDYVHVQPYENTFKFLKELPT